MTQELHMAMITQPIQPTLRDLWKNARMIGGIAAVICAFILVSGTITYVCNLIKSTTSGEVGWFSSFYFTTMNFTTVGFGDYVPNGVGGQCIAIVNALVGLFAIGALVAVFTAAWMPGSSGSAVVEAGPSSNLSIRLVGDGKTRLGKKSVANVLREVADLYDKKMSAQETLDHMKEVQPVSAGLSVYITIAL